MRVAFHVNAFGIRGSEVAIYDYAHYNEELLGNKSIIVAPHNCRMATDVKGKPYHNHRIEFKFKQRFTVKFYQDEADLNRILESCDVLYYLKSGERDSLNISSCFYAVHCVFVCNEHEKHGNVYAAISNCVNGMNFRDNNTQYSGDVVPHIIPPKPRVKGDLRSSLGISPSDIVFGRYGGYETFDIPFVKQTVIKVAQNHSNIHFIFMNTEPFADLPNIHFLDKKTNWDDKALFINTCDAMLHGRQLGESFGIAIAEFSILNKPVLTWKRPADQQNPDEHTEHIRILGNKGFYYTNLQDLEQILTTWNRKEGDYDCYSEQFSPHNVMKKFDDVFLKPARHKFRVRLTCNFTNTDRELCEKWNKLSKGNFTWDNIQVTWSDINIDYYVVINRPNPNTKCNPDRTIVMYMEPHAETNKHFTEWLSGAIYLGIHPLHLNNVEWHLASSYKQLAIIKPLKYRTISAIDSGQYLFPGHKLRVDFLRFLCGKDLDIDIYGHNNPHGLSKYKGSLPSGKEAGLLPYKYTFAAENHAISNYVTEKLFDGILSECLVFYWGCPNVSDFIDPKCYINLDLADPEKSYQTIIQTIQNNEWEKRLPSIRQEKRKILDQLSFFPRIQGIITVHNAFIRVINLEKRTDRWKSFQSRFKGEFKYSRFNAINKQLAETYYAPLWRNSHIVSLTQNGGAKGCAASHFELWKECVNSNRIMVVFEDDVEFDGHFADRLTMSCQKIKWDVLFIGYHLHEQNMIDNNITISNINENSFDSIGFDEIKRKYPKGPESFGYMGGGTFGYIITPVGAKKYLTEIYRRGFLYPVDYEMMLNGNVNIHLSRTPLVYSNKALPKNESSVQILMKIMEISHEEAYKKIFETDSDIQKT